MASERELRKAEEALEMRLKGDPLYGYIDPDAQRKKINRLKEDLRIEAENKEREEKKARERQAREQAQRSYSSSASSYDSGGGESGGLFGSVKLWFYVIIIILAVCLLINIWPLILIGVLGFVLWRYRGRIKRLINKDNGTDDDTAASEEDMQNRDADTIMYCPHCGAQNQRDSNFCIACGQSISVDENASDEQDS